MYSLNDIAANLRVKERTVRLYLDALRPSIEGYIERGANNRVLCSQTAYQLIERLHTIRIQDGLTIQAAALKVTEGLQPAPQQLDPLLQEKERLIEHLEEAIAHRDEELKKKDEEIAFLRTQVDRLTPLALPPQRKRWSLFHRKSS